MANKTFLHWFVLVNTIILTILSIIGLICINSIDPGQLGVVFFGPPAIANVLLLYGILKKKTNFFWPWMCLGFIFNILMTFGIIVNLLDITLKDLGETIAYSAIYIYSVWLFVAVNRYYKEIKKWNEYRPIQTVYTILDYSDVYLTGKKGQLI